MHLAAHARHTDVVGTIPGSGTGAHLAIGSTAQAASDRLFRRHRPFSGLLCFALVAMRVVAAGSGDLAFCVVFPNARWWMATCAPSDLRRWLHTRKTQVAAFELVAALNAVYAVLAVSHDIELNVFIDSSAALGVLRRGTSRQSDYNELVAELWYAVATRAVFLGLWRVPSAQNIADAPTRRQKKWREMRALAAAGFVERPWHWMGHLPWQRRWC